MKLIILEIYFIKVYLIRYSFEAGRNSLYKKKFVTRSTSYRKFNSDFTILQKKKIDEGELVPKFVEIIVAIIFI